MRGGWAPITLTACALLGCAEGGGTRVAARDDCAQASDCPRGRSCVAGQCVIDADDAGPKPDMASLADGSPHPEDSQATAVVDAGDPVDAASVDVGIDAMGPIEDAAVVGPDAADLPCATGARRDCGRSVGLCRRGAQVCGADATWGPCEGGVAPAGEVCNLADDDCNGVVDDGFGVGEACEGVGACGEGLVECRNSVRTRCSTDPGGSADGARVETCNAVDDDCDGTVDEGQRVGADCDGMCGPGGLECDDGGATRCSTDPGGSESVPRAETCNGRDDDCNGTVDDTFDLGGVCVGVGACGAGARECDDAGGVRCSSDAAGSAPQGRDELCNGEDDDCDGTVDEGFDLGAACQGVGGCGDGRLECDAEGNILCSTDAGGSMSGVRAEACNEVDDDCDGAVDEGLGLGAACPGVGRCPAGTLACAGDGAVVCSTFPGGPDDRGRAEVCDGEDDDCDGRVDETFDLGMACQGMGVCGGGVRECDDGGGARCSTAPGGSADASIDEACNGADDDCDGRVDEGGACGGDTCETAPPFDTSAGATGSTAMLEDDYPRSLCLAASPGRDQVFRLEVPAAARWAVAVAPLTAGYDPLFWVTNGAVCGDSVLNCLGGRAREAAGRPEGLMVEFQRADSFLLVVDARGDLSGGPFIASARPAAEGETCGSAIRLGVPARFPGTTEGRTGDVAGSACPANTLTAGPEQVFRLDLAAPQALRITAVSGASTDVALYVTSDCAQVDAGCAGGHNAVGNGLAETLDVDLAAGTWFVVVDHVGNQGGPFLLEITPR